MSIFLLHNTIIFQELSIQSHFFLISLKYKQSKGLNRKYGKNVHFFSSFRFKIIWSPYRYFRSQIIIRLVRVEVWASHFFHKNCKWFISCARFILLVATDKSNFSGFMFQNNWIEWRKKRRRSWIDTSFCLPRFINLIMNFFKLKYLFWSLTKEFMKHNEQTSVTVEISTLEVFMFEIAVYSLPSSRIIRTINAISSTWNRYKMVLFSVGFCLSLSVCVVFLFSFISQKWFLVPRSNFVYYVWKDFFSVGIFARFNSNLMMRTPFTPDFIWCRKTIIVFSVCFFVFRFEQKKN